MTRIAICAPATPITREDAARVEALAKARKAQQNASGPPLPRKPKGLEDRS